jgi:hypothetical protein
MFLAIIIIIIDHPNLNGIPRTTIYEYSYQQQVISRNGQCRKITKYIIAHDNYCAPELLPHLRNQSPITIYACKLDTWNLDVSMLSALAHQANIDEYTMDVNKWQQLLDTTKVQFNSVSCFTAEERRAIQSLTPLLNKIVQPMHIDPGQRANLARITHLAV